MERSTAFQSEGFRPFPPRTRFNFFREDARRDGPPMARRAHGMFHGSMIPTRLGRLWKASCVPLSFKTNRAANRGSPVNRVDNLEAIAAARGILSRLRPSRRNSAGERQQR